MKLTNLTFIAIFLSASFAVASVVQGNSQYNVLECEANSSKVSVSIIAYTGRISHKTEYKAIVLTDSDEATFYVNRNEFNPKLENNGAGYTGRGFALRIEKRVQDLMESHLSVPSVGVRDLKVLCR